MASNPTVWGIHMGAHVSDRPIDGGYVAIGWTAMGDLRKISSNREAFKAALVFAYPDKKAGAIPVDAGTMFKFPALCIKRTNNLADFAAHVNHNGAWEHRLSIQA